MKQKAICVDNSGSYQYRLTVGKLYEVEKVPGIFDTRPFYEFVADDGKEGASHTYRFEIVEAADAIDAAQKN